MESDMSFLNDLVRQVREQHGLTLEAAAFNSDLSTSAINRYELGEREVPVRYFRALYEMTHDPRLLLWLNPDVAEAVSAVTTKTKPAPQRTPPPANPTELLKAELDAARELVDACHVMHTITADGKINEADSQSVVNLQKHHIRMRQITERVDRALIAWLDRNGRTTNGREQ